MSNKCPNCGSKNLRIDFSVKVASEIAIPYGSGNSGGAVLERKPRIVTSLQCRECGTWFPEE